LRIETVAPSSALVARCGVSCSPLAGKNAAARSGLLRFVSMHRSQEHPPPPDERRTYRVLFRYLCDECGEEWLAPGRCGACPDGMVLSKPIFDPHPTPPRRRRPA
jgi:hypothetical protein